MSSPHPHNRGPSVAELDAAFEAANNCCQAVWFLLAAISHLPLALRPRSWHKGCISKTFTPTPEAVTP